LETLIVARLEDAGRVLLALPMRGYSTVLRTGYPDVVHDIQAYGWHGEQPRIPVPSADRITRLEETLDWMRLIPAEELRLKRVVGRRMLVHPLSDKHLYSWRRIGRDLQVDHKTAQHWHDRAIDLLGAGLRLRFSSTRGW
jgi:hypothetical protein